MAHLLQLNEKAMGTTYPVDGNEVLVGRDPECSVVLPMQSVSSRQMRFILDPATKKYTVENLADGGDYAQTAVDGTVIKEPREIRDGNIITVNRKIVFQFMHAPQLSLASEGSARSDRLSSFDSGLSSDSVASRLSVESLSAAEEPSAIGGKDDLRYRAAQHRLQCMYGMMETLGQQKTAEGAFAAFLSGVLNAIPQADRAIIILLEDNTLHPRYVRERKESASGDIGVSTSIATDAIQSGEALRIDSPSSQSMMDNSIQAQLVVPLMDSEEHPIGVLQVDTTTPRQTFSDNDLHLLAAVAPPTVMILQNIALVESEARQEVIAKNAREVQESFMDAPPEMGDIESGVVSQSADPEGTGDFYTWLKLSDGRTVCVLADAEGHGLPAGLKMSAHAHNISAGAYVADVLRIASHDCNENDDITSLTGAVEQMNRLASRRIDGQVSSGKNKTIGLLPSTFLAFDTEKENVELVLAGQDAPLCLRADGTVEVWDEEGSFPLGVDEDANYPSSQHAFRSGDTIVMVTDGASEGEDVTGALYRSTDRLKGLMHSRAGEPIIAQKLAQIIYDDVLEFTGGIREDDISVMVFKRPPASDS